MTASIPKPNMLNTQVRKGKFRYSWNSFGGDVCGGLIASLVAFPYGLAMAAAMGLPPVLGVFTSILSAHITALLGRNAVMIGGTSSVTIPFISVAVRSQGLGGAAKVSIVAAVLMLVFSFLRLGRYVAWVPKPVMAGFSCGIGGMMVVTQLPTILGLTGSHATTFETLEQSARAILHPGSLPLTAILCALIVGIVATLSSRISHRTPALLIGIVAAVGMMSLLGMHPKNIGYLSSALPPFVGFSWAPGDVFTVPPAAAGLRVRHFGEPAGHLARGRAFSRTPSGDEEVRCGSRTRSLRYRQHGFGSFRRADERWYSGAQPG